jgi:hypothetical protein
MKGNPSKKAKLGAFIYEDRAITKGDSNEEAVHEVPTHLIEQHRNSQPKSSQKLFIHAAGFTSSSSGSKRVAMFNDSENVHPNESHEDLRVLTKKYTQNLTDMKSNKMRVTNSTTLRADAAKPDNVEVPQAVSGSSTGLKSTEIAHRDLEINIGVRRSNRICKPVSHDGLDRTSLNSSTIWSNGIPLTDAVCEPSATKAGKNLGAGEIGVPKKFITVADVLNISQDKNGKRELDDIRSSFGTSVSTSTPSQPHLLQTTGEGSQTRSNNTTTRERLALDTSALILGFVGDENASGDAATSILYMLGEASSLSETSDAASISFFSEKATLAAQFVERATDFYKIQQGEHAHNKCRETSNNIQTGKLDPAEALFIATSAIMMEMHPNVSHENLVFCAAQLALSPLFGTLGRISQLATSEDHTSSCAGEFRRSPKVTFRGADGSSISPSKDRLPCSWENTWANAEEFRNLFREIRTIVGECFAISETARKESDSQRCLIHRVALTALLTAVIAFRDPKCPLVLKVMPLSAKTRAEAKYLGSALFGEIASQIAQLSSQNESQKLAKQNDISNSASWPAAASSELRRRANWMAASVARFQLRYIFDAEPFQISKPGLAGPVDFSKCRSGLHHIIQLCSSGPRRMRQLCIPPQEFKNCELIKLFNGAALCRSTVLAALPRAFDVDPSEVSLSTLVIRALRQLVIAVNEIGAQTEMPVGSLLSAESLSRALCLEKVARVIGLDKDIIQIALAAEYARRFLCDISLIPGTENVTTQSTRFTNQNVWNVLSQCAAAIKELAIQESAEDIFIMLFTDGWDAYQERIREPLISSEFIAECQLLFHEHLRQDILDRLNEPQSFVVPSSEAPSVLESLDPRYFRLVNTDVILDFPQVRLAR